MLVLADAALADSIRKSLQDRLAELGQASGPNSTDATDADAEESLRLLMVRHRPRLMRRDETLDREDMAVCIRSIAALASWRDLRFIDGLNLLYESWPVGFSAQARDSFIACYRQALQRMLSQ